MPNQNLCDDRPPASVEVDAWYPGANEMEAIDLHTLVTPHLKPGLVAGPVECVADQWGFRVQGRYQP